jgi:hypothetical protein
LHCRGAIGRPGRMDARPAALRGSAARSGRAPPPLPRMFREMQHTPCNMQCAVQHVNTRRATCNTRRATCNASSARAVAWAARDGRTFAGLAFSHCHTFGRAYPQANETEVDALYARVAELERFSAACTCQDTRGNLACDRRHTWHATGGTTGVQRAILRFPTARTGRDTRCVTATAPRERARAHARAHAWLPPREASVGSRPCAAAELFAMRAR